jgi:GNAT superfamily N-acetyltransferase
VIVATQAEEAKETVLAVGQYGIDEQTHTAEVAFVVRDGYQNRGIGTQLLTYLTYLAKRQGLLGFSAEVLLDNKIMLHVFEKMGFEIKRSLLEGVYQLKMRF